MTCSRFHPDPGFLEIARTQGDSNGGITPSENRRRFFDATVCAGCLLIG